MEGGRQRNHQWRHSMSPALEAWKSSIFGRKVGSINVHEIPKINLGFIAYVICSFQGSASKSR